MFFSFLVLYTLFYTICFNCICIANYIVSMFAMENNYANFAIIYKYEFFICYMWKLSKKKWERLTIWALQRPILDSYSAHPSKTYGPIQSQSKSDQMLTNLAIWPHNITYTHQCIDLKVTKSVHKIEIRSTFFKFVWVINQFIFLFDLFWHAQLSSFLKIS